MKILKIIIILLCVSFSAFAQTKVKLSDLQKGTSANQIPITDASGTLTFKPASNAINFTGGVLTSVVNGISATATLPIVSTSNAIDFTGGVLTSVVNGISATTPIVINNTTTNTFTSNTNTLTSVVNGVSATANVVNSHSVNISNGVLTSTVNGVPATATLPIISTSNTIDFTGGVLTSVVNGISATTPIVINNTTTNTFTSNTNTLTSVVNGVSASANIINSNVLGSTNNTLSSAINGVVTSSNIINTNVLNSVNNTLTSNINGISASASVVNQNVLNTSNGTLTSTINGIASTTSVLTSSNNGLNNTNGVVSLGGALTQATIIGTSATNTLAITGLSAGTVTDQIIVSSSGGVLKSAFMSALLVNNMYSFGNTVGSAVNGQTSTTSIISSNALNLNSGVLTSVINGISATANLNASRTLSVSGLLNTVNGGSATASVFENIPTVIKIDLGAGRRLLSVTTPSSNTSVSVVDQINGLVLVKAGANNVVLNATDQAMLPTLNGLQRVDVTNTTLNVTTTDQSYALGTTLQAGDLLEVEHRFNGTTTEREMVWVKVVAGTTQRAAPWPDVTNMHYFTFPATLTNSFTVKASSTSSTPNILSVKVWRDGANGYVVPTGTVVANPRLVSASATGGLNTVNGALSVTTFENFPSLLTINLNTGKQLSQTISATNGASVTIINPMTGTVMFTPGATNSVINYAEVPQATAFDFVEVNQTTTQNTGLTVGSPILFSTPTILGNIPFSNGVFTLQAGKTYSLLGGVTFINGTELIMQWRDITNNVLLGNSANILTSAAGRGHIASASIKPTTPITVRLEITSANGLVAINSDTNRGAWAKITQIASDNFIIPTGTVMASPCLVTANAGALTVNGMATYQAYQNLSYQFQIGLPTGRKLQSCKVNGVDVPIANPIMGTVNYTPTSNTVDFQVTDALASTFTGRQTIGRYTAATPVDINNSTITTNIDMRNAKYLSITLVDNASIAFDGVSGVHTWQTVEYDLAYLRSNNGVGYAQTFSNAYIEFHIQDFTTGKIFFNDQVKAMQVKEIFVEDDAANGFVIPTGTTVRSAVIVTCNNGSTTINNSTNTTLFSGTSSRVMVTVPSGQMINTATINNGLAVAISDAYTGALEVGIANGASATAANITATFVAIPSGIVRFTPATGTAALVFTNNGTSCTYNFTATRSGLWDIESNIMVWDDVQSPDIAGVVEVLQGTTVLDAFQLGGLNSNHLNNNWMAFGQASNRANLVAGTTYTVRVTSNGSGALNGVGIQSMVLRLAQAGNSPVPIGTTTKTPVTATLSSQTWSHTGTATAVVLEDAGFYTFQIVPPANQVLSSVTSVPANIVTLKDVTSNQVFVNVPAGTGNITVTPSFVASPVKVNFKNTTAIQFDYNTWASRNFGSPGNGLTGPDANNFYTAQRDMVLNLVSTFEASEGSGITIGMNWQALANGGTNWQDISPMTTTQTVSGSGALRFTQFRSIYLKSGDQIRFQSNVLQNYPGTRNVRFSITEE